MARGEPMYVTGLDKETNTVYIGPAEALNRSNLIKVNATYGDGAAPLAAFGKPVAGIASSDPARQFQFGLKWLF